jgi:hypothetical protein
MSCTEVSGGAADAPPPASHKAAASAVETAANFRIIITNLLIFYRQSGPQAARAGIGWAHSATWIVKGGSVRCPKIAPGTVPAIPLRPKDLTSLKIYFNEL